MAGEWRENESQCVHVCMREREMERERELVCVCVCVSDRLVEGRDGEEVSARVPAEEGVAALGRLLVLRDEKLPHLDLD